ncbi:hypothetical protein TNCT6_57840 [Streptomyces sp. 6-11-2]|nr:hypothetical protein TNCT6_57840 [Streptomyces sp. 6-11-2]
MVPRRVTLAAHTDSPCPRTGRCGAASAALVFLLTNVIEPVGRIAQPAVRGEGNPVRPVPEPLPREHRASPSSSPASADPVGDGVLP